MMVLLTYYLVFSFCCWKTEGYWRWLFPLEFIPSFKAFVFFATDVFIAPQA